ncbi:hypothetical protein KP509_05G033700 [Ceratopteris richardii]|uniref:Small acidic protein 1 n=1 Tax=Ceratopteris richardii TaxID=49495 RepID=A0A8T2UQ79_CERRI|nr:hypothetical protein KP509_05G033700 [Ceratopteris richardii]
MKTPIVADLEDGAAGTTAMDVDGDNDISDFFCDSTAEARPHVDADFFNSFEDDFDDSDIA